MAHRHHAADALCTGSAALVQRGWNWVTAGDWRTAGERLAYVAGGAYGVGYAAHLHPEIAMPVGVIGWCVAAWMHSPEPDPENPDEETDDQAPEDDEEAQHIGHDEAEHDACHADLIRWLDEVTRGRNGIHLTELYDRLRERPALTHLEDVQLRAMLDHFDVPVARTLSVDGIAGRSGVRRADIDALLDPAPPEDESPSRPFETGDDLRELRPLSPRSQDALKPLSPVPEPTSRTSETTHDVPHETIT